MTQWWVYRIGGAIRAASQAPTEECQEGPLDDAADAEFKAFLNPAPTSFLPQDLLGQLTTQDIAAIQSAVSSNAQMALLWFSLLAQKDPMQIGNDRVKAGWAALVQILGQPRMTAIATALNISP